jgi:hypothetical protein
MAIKVKRITIDKEDMYDDGFEDILASQINDGEYGDSITSDNLLCITQNQNEFTIFYEDDREVEE